jgi:hypothetical protein
MTKHIYISIVFLALSFTLHAQAVGKTLTKSFNPDGKSSIVLELPGNTDIKTWDTPTIKIEFNVGLASGNSAMLNELANVGRYNLVAKANAESILVQMPNMQKQVRVKGEVLKEVLTFTAYVPKNMNVQTVNTIVLLAASTQ